MTLLRTIKSAVVAVSALAVAFTGGTAVAAANTSAYTMQLSGSTVNVYETNSEAVNAVQADFVYSGSVSSFTITPAVGGTFTTCLSQTTASVACTILGGSASTGQAHLVASLTFTPKAGVTDASITVSMASSSQILATAGSTDTLNHNTLPSYTYTYSAPVATPTTPVTTPPTNNPSKPSNTTNNTSSTRPTSPTAHTPTTDGGHNNKPSTNNTKPSQNANKNSTSGNHKEQPRHIISRHAGLVTSTVSALAILGAAVYWLVLRKRTIAEPAKAYKLDAPTTAARHKPTVKKPVVGSQTTTRSTAGKTAAAKAKKAAR